MAKINKLPPHIADLIAAGEVVERPGSVIKELVENSIDAGASVITIEIKNGGMSYMRLTDNGSGMAPDDAEIAFLRHATSKLRDERGLEAIGTLGFRGEALAAISAVSRINMVTREISSDSGTEIVLEGGTVIHKRPIGCPVGTTIVVRDLFFNTPARLKFMKSDRAEGANVSAVVMRCALSHPDISIRYIKDGKEEYHTPGDGRMDSCSYSILGREFASDLLEVVGTDNVISVKGYVTAPVNARGNRNYQFFYINGRFVKSKTLQAALEQAYKNSIFNGRFPGCVLYIDMSLASVDVNVHPTKTEVKFLNEKQVFDAVYYSVLSALEGESKKAKINISPSTREVISKNLPRENHNAVSSENKKIYFQDNLTSPVSAQPLHGTKPDRETFSIPSPEKYSKLSTGISERGGYSQIHSPAPAFYQTEINFSSRPLSPQADILSSQSPGSSEEPSYCDNLSSVGIQPPDTKTVPVKIENYGLHQSSNSEATNAETPSDTKTLHLNYRIIGEAMSTYIIVEKGESLFLIDKHAAHERMLFDKLKSETGDIMSQKLLSPFIYETDKESAAVLIENSNYLEKLGFEIDEFGNNCIALRALPADIKQENISPLLGELADKLISGHKTAPDSLRDEILHSVACRAAIKAGKYSSESELKAITSAVMSGEVKYCPHGRPVAMEITKGALDKNFKRI